ncbi:MAG: CPBP family intramembrane metalloprotease [bacterium]|nr:CPBP family intramembrane metalloprotease [bacterium]
MREFLRRVGYDGRQGNTYIVLLSAPVLLTIYRYRGWADRFADWFPGLAGHPLAGLFAVVFQWSSFFLLVLVIPFIFAGVRMGFTPGEMGIKWGDRRFGLIFVALALPLLVVPFSLLASSMPDVRLEYPLARIVTTRTDLVLVYEAAYVLLYYLAWEFFFRGFMLFPLARVFGGMNAILIQTIPSCLLHIGKPEGEVTGSILAGLVFGTLALRTGSIWYGWVLHAALGVLVDLLVIFR